MKEIEENLLGEFAIEKETNRVITKPFGDPVGEEFLNNKGYDIVKFSFGFWQENLQCHPVGYAPYLVNGEIEYRELPEFHDQLEKERREEELRELKEYLAETDYIIAKIHEFMLEDEEEGKRIKEEYKDELIRRKNARQRINELEALLEQSNA